MAERSDAQLCKTMQTVKRGSSRRLAWQTLLERHQGLVRHLSYRYVLPGMSRSDVFQQAILGFRYSAMSYDPSKAKFNTHLGWGVMKYCLMLRQDEQKHSREKCVSQGKDTSEKYQQALSRTPPKRPRLTVDGYRKLLRECEPLGVTRAEEKMVLGIAYHVGSPRRRKAWRVHLWNVWLERKIRSLCRRIEKRKMEQQGAI